MKILVRMARIYDPSYPRVRGRKKPAASAPSAAPIVFTEYSKLPDFPNNPRSFMTYCPMIGNVPPIKNAGKNNNPVASRNLTMTNTDFWFAK